MTKEMFDRELTHIAKNLQKQVAPLQSVSVTEIKRALLYAARKKGVKK